MGIEMNSCSTKADAMASSDEYVGNCKKITIKQNKKHLRIVGNENHICIKQNSGTIEVIGNSARVKVLDNSGTITYIGNNGKIQLASDANGAKIKYIGSNGTVKVNDKEDVDRKSSKMMSSNVKPPKSFKSMCDDDLKNYFDKKFCVFNKHELLVANNNNISLPNLDVLGNLHASVDSNLIRFAQSNIVINKK